ncbi:PTS sugar transporter subunit IIA [Sporolactobacillus putidus]|uniref:Ascorbate-specific PTS system EIIA component n=1 Tax=Sporolactobacillus putidus TaxID=492735 RepID=A0A917S5J3_9BACL|nr:PTS sugar transporter subunit IIA [Sporolactobacillus putidus]GGL57359.1 PTS mannitol transporter subunit IIA [Sporolactobacillus putidus]
MLSSLLTAETIQIGHADKISWSDAIRKAAEPLLSTGKIKESYIKAMISLVEENGPYINIGPNIALAHARPENGVKKMGMSLLKVDSAINLVNKDHPIKLFFVLAAVDNTKHLQALKELTTLLGNPDIVKRIEKASSVSEIVREIKEDDEK